VNREYFERYCGAGTYDEEYLHYTRVGHCVSIVDRFGIPVDSVLVLGTATGQVLRHFEEAWQVRPWGCEISQWAHARVPARYRRRVRRADMRDYVPELLRAGRRFDLVFSNSLVYLRKREIRELLAGCARLGAYFHFWSSTLEDHEPHDPYRVTLAPRAWWAEAFRGAGFERTRSPYLWRSRQLTGK
jgi:hypothetical protein